MGFKIALLALLLCRIAIQTRGSSISPFGLVEDYILEFEQALHKMKSAEGYPNIHQDHHFGDHDATKALSGAEEFDFIIVGSGASGATLANRLSEVPEWKVLLLEAGDIETTITQVPSMQPYLMSTPYTWEYHTVPQNKSCQCMENYQCTIGTGRAMGGDTATNDMLYVRGHPRDYDLWADTGMLGWCWDSVKPYFKKMEDAFAEELDRKEHHYGGPVHIENFQHSTHLAQQLLEAAHELGYKEIDYNGKERLGFGRPQATTKYGKRNSASQIHLTPSYRRRNLVIKPLSHVVKILISTHTHEAHGVVYLHEGHLFVAKSSKEVILAAGAINSAQLLLLSGIGPKEDLLPLNIPVVSDLKVGHNLKDHIAFVGLNFVLPQQHTKEHLECEGQNEMVKYLKSGKGPLTTTGAELIGFLKTGMLKDKLDYPDIELLVTRNIYNQGHQHLQHLHITEETYNAVFQPLEEKEGFTIQVVLLHPKSKGYVKLHDEDPLHPPIINPMYLSDEDDEDLETLLAGIHLAIKLTDTESFKKLGAAFDPHQIPECHQHIKHEDAYWKCAIRHLSISLRHPSGTARMGPDTDHTAVVDKDLRVYGVHKLRVADASVIPVSISGSLTAAEYLIGEHGADIIKTDWLGDKMI